MKRIYRIIFSVFLFLGLTATANFAGVEKYGDPISNYKITEIKDILANPKAFEGKTVTIEGKIANECSTGCWFIVKVKEGNVTIYVDIGNSGFAIPQKTGHNLIVEGKVVLKKSGPMVQGKGVEVK